MCIDWLSITRQLITYPHTDTLYIYVYTYMYLTIRKFNKSNNTISFYRKEDLRLKV